MKHGLAYSILVFFIALGLGIGILVLKPKEAPCSEFYRKDLTIHYEGQTINAQRSTTDQQKQTGLGGKDCIGPNQAMLFSFDKPGFYPFWMKAMKFNIDILWIGSNHQVVYRADDVSPSSYPKNFVNDTPAKDVIELAAGNAEKLGITTGSKLIY